MAKSRLHELSEQGVSVWIDSLSREWLENGELQRLIDEDGVDGFVSIEVDPTLAYDREATYEEAMRLHELVDRPNVYVKIPATALGLSAIEDCIAATKSINVTLIFSLERYKAVVE